MILDEIQRAPELFLPLKATVDSDRRPERFLPTESANALLLPQLADALVGRMELLTLWPLAQCEIEATDSDWIDHIFTRGPLPVQQFKSSRQDVVKAPKVLLNDSGILAYLAGMDEANLERSPTAAGALVENFVDMELVKLTTWSEARPHIFYFRTHDGKKVDFLLQDRTGAVVGVEVKAASTLQEADFKGLQVLAALLGEQFIRGIVLYTGDAQSPFGPQLTAMPIAALWSSIDS